MDHQFTAKMQAALGHYARDPSRSKVAAYKHAYDCSRMQTQTIAVRATELFKHPLMAQAVSHMKAAAAKTVAIDAAWVLKRAALLANFNIKKFIKKQADGTAVYDFTTATDDDWYCIDEYTVDTIAKGRGADAYEVDRVKLKSVSKIAALKMVGDHVDVKAFQENVNHTGAVVLANLNAEEFKEARREMLNEDKC
jgi:hypothetical protein